MLIKTIPVGRLAANCYVVADENTLDCAVIDPGDESGAILDYLEEHRLCCRLILLTHGHADHVSAAAALAEETGAAVCMNEKDAHIQLGTGSGYIPPEGTRFCREGDLLQAGGLTFAVLETPGHTPGGLTFRCEDALFTGDTLFSGSCGRTDLPGGSMSALVRSIKEKVFKLPDLTVVYTGHGEPTKIGFEKQYNPFI